MGLVLAIVVVGVLVAGAAVAGTLLGPKLLGGHAEKSTKDKDKQEHAEDPKDKPIGETTELSPILVDTRAADGGLHHLKVVLAIELAEGSKKDEFMKYAPRGREATVAYLRGQTFDSLAAPERYNEVRAEIGKQFTEAVGASRVSRVLVTDFVAQ